MKTNLEEWEQGASGYGRLTCVIIGNISIQRTVTYGLSSFLHEDTATLIQQKGILWPRAVALQRFCPP